MGDIEWCLRCGKKKKKIKIELKKKTKKENKNEKKKLTKYCNETHYIVTECVKILTQVDGLQVFFSELTITVP